RGGEAVPLGGGDGGRPRDRRAVAVRPELHAHRELRGDRGRGHARQGRASRDRLREAARPQCLRSEAGPRAHEKDRDRSRLSREPGVCARRGAGPRHHMGPRRGAHRPPLPRPGGGGAQRTPHALVLAGQAPGRRGPQRHDVSLRPGGATPVDAARRAARIRAPGPRHGAHRELKWSQPAYAKRLQQQMGKDVDYRKAPSEDFASVTIEFETDERATLIGEASTSWSFVGAGLRLSAELLGPEYSMAWNTLDSGLKLFFSREVKGKAGEDLVEKQNAEVGLMPVVANEAAAYGYEAENRHFVRVFLGLESPALTFEDGLEVVKVLMTAYQSAEQGKTLDFPPPGIEKFVPAVAKGTWKP